MCQHDDRAAGVRQSLRSELAVLKQMELKVTKTVVTTEPVLVPKEFEQLFDDPALVGDEQRESYNAVFSILATAVKPADAVQWVYFDDVVYSTWEIQRVRKIKAAYINLLLKKVAEVRFGWTRADLERQRRLAEKIIDGELKMEDVKPEPKPKPEDPATLLAKAYLLGLDDIEAFDKQIALFEARRNNALRELAWQNETTARELDKASRDIIDGEFTEATK
jgi:hypothetical protein